MNDRTRVPLHVYVLLQVYGRLHTSYMYASRVNICLFVFLPRLRCPAPRWLSVPVHVHPSTVSSLLPLKLGTLVTFGRQAAPTEAASLSDVIYASARE